MQIESMTLQNFRCYEQKEIQFSQVTAIQGHNGAGKSTLAEAIVWCLYGTDMLGKSKQDENLMRLGTKSMAVAVTFVNEAGKSLTVSRIRSSKRASAMTVNGSRPKPGQVEGWFGAVSEFLSVFFPGYFSSLEPKEAKLILSKCVPDVPKEDVLSRMNGDAAELLAHDKFVMGLESVDFAMKRVRDDMAELEKSITPYEGEMDAYQAVIERGEPKPFVSEITAEMLKQFEASKREVVKNEAGFENRDEQLQALLAQHTSLADTYRTLKASVPNVDKNCPTCGQKLLTLRADEIRQQVALKQRGILRNLEQIVAEGKRVKAEIERLTTLPKTSPVVQTLKQNIEQVENKLRTVHPHKNRPRTIKTNKKKGNKGRNAWQKTIRMNQTLKNNIEQRGKKLRDEHQLQIAHAAMIQMYQMAKENIAKTKQSMMDEQKQLEATERKLKALQDFRFEYVRTQHAKLNSLFDHVRIHLMDWNKETGEIRESFRIDWKGRPYRLLSFSEKIRCDLEIGRVLTEARGEAMPVYVDNAESVQDLLAEHFRGQVIAAYVADTKLTVKHQQVDPQVA